MKKYKLGEIANIQISSVDKKSKDGEIPVKLCNFVDVYYNYAITKEMVANFMNATARQSEIDIFKLQKGQVALTKDSETRYDIGVPTYIADTFENVILGYHTALVTPNQEILNGKYLNAFLNTKYIQKYFENNATGSGQRYSLSNEVLANIPIIAPDLPTQKKIGHLFSNIDKKIAINNQINELLECTARAIYEYYFVQFDFPNKQGQPYKSSGGAMSFDSTLNRPIPKDFEVILLKEMCDIESGYPFSTDDYANNGKYKIITIKNVLNNYISSDTDNTIDFIPKNMPNYCSLKIGDILLSLTGNVGRVGIVFENNLLLNQRVGLLKLKNQNYRSFVYLTFLQQHFKQILENIATGSNQKNLSPIETEKLPILFSQETIKEFESITKPLLDKIINNHTENQKLKNLRDFLLPLLINAQVQI